MSNRTQHVPLYKIADLQILPTDLVRIICSETVLDSFRNVQMVEIIEALERKLKIRQHNGGKK